jgi:hypothetical protein
MMNDGCKIMRIVVVLLRQNERNINITTNVLCLVVVDNYHHLRLRFILLMRIIYNVLLFISNASENNFNDYVTHLLLTWQSYLMIL